MAVKVTAAAVDLFPQRPERCSERPPGFNTTWRHIDGRVPPERVGLAGGGGFPSTVSSQNRLVFTRQTGQPHIYRLQLGGAPTSLVESTFSDVFPQYSPDGLRIAFQSDRAGGKREVWLADADGSNPTRLTRGPGRYQGSPRWSPDGRSIAFDSQAENGHADIWTIGVDGSGLRQVTHHPADDVVPSFSRDGHFIYFASNRTGRNEVWRVAVAAGVEEQVTRDGGILAFERLDGQTLYYVRGFNAALLARSTTRGGERTIRSCVSALALAVAPRGLFFEDCSPPDVAASGLRTLRF